MDVNELEEYTKSISELKTEYKDKIRIHLGLECEFFPKFTSWLLETKNRYKIEYLILGVHYPACEQGFKPFASAKSEYEIKQYTQQVIEGMNSGLFSYLCHPDLPLKSYPKFDKVIITMSETICKEASRLDIPLEYNTAGIRLRNTQTTGHGYTCDEFWQIAASYNCKAIIASDAHEPQILADTPSLKKAENKLKKLKIEIIKNLQNLD